jgi:hypothetical protein
VLSRVSCVAVKGPLVLSRVSGVAVKGLHDSLLFRRPVPCDGISGRDNSTLEGHRRND